MAALLLGARHPARAQSTHADLASRPALCPSLTTSSLKSSPLMPPTIDFKRRFKLRLVVAALGDTQRLGW